MESVEKSDGFIRRCINLGKKFLYGSSKELLQKSNLQESSDSSESANSSFPAGQNRLVPSGGFKMLGTQTRSNSIFPHEASSFNFKEKPNFNPADLFQDLQGQDLQSYTTHGNRTILRPKRRLSNKPSEMNSFQLPEFGKDNLFRVEGLDTRNMLVSNSQNHNLQPTAETFSYNSEDFDSNISRIMQGNSSATMSGDDGLSQQALHELNQITTTFTGINLSGSIQSVPQPAPSKTLIDMKCKMDSKILFHDSVRRSERKTTLNTEMLKPEGSKRWKIQRENGSTFLNHESGEGQGSSKIFHYISPSWLYNTKNVVANEEADKEMNEEISCMKCHNSRMKRKTNEQGSKTTGKSNMENKRNKKKRNKMSNVLNDNEASSSTPTKLTSLETLMFRKEKDSRWSDEFNKFRAFKK